LIESHEENQEECLIENHEESLEEYLIENHEESESHEESHVKNIV
jgi:hypothetical protein